MLISLRTFSHGMALLTTAALLLSAGSRSAGADDLPRYASSIQNVRVLTQNPDHLSPWDNAEAYFSSDGRSLIFQASRAPHACDAIYTMDLSGKNSRMISSGEGRCTCSYYSPDGKWIVYASTQLSGKECPPRPEMNQGYTWPVYPSYEIYKVPVDGGKNLR